ncbi:MAG TPA: TusE/DsrC/DsvC family sulfur relay protein [Thiotrichales bacterium]|nr:TusE/DsrC/DsvC family sulfur relay protein [Thiotrichales bacterium]
MSAGIPVDRDAEGYLVDPETWSEEVARALAAEEGIELDDRYWPILHFMRGYWTEHRVAPDVRHVVDFLMAEQGFDKKSAKQHLFRLFPYGYVKQACKIAGMQRPRAWSTG